MKLAFGHDIQCKWHIFIVQNTVLRGKENIMKPSNYELLFFRFQVFTVQYCKTENFSSGPYKVSKLRYKHFVMKT